MGCAKDGQSIDYHEALARLQRAAVCHSAVLQSTRASRFDATTTNPNGHAHSSSSAQAREIPLNGLVGKRCSKTVFATFQTPAVDTSAMDGYAVCSTLTVHATRIQPLRFRVVGTIAAGDQDVRQAENYGTEKQDSSPVCVEIMTGAAFPQNTHPNLDAVVKLEDVVEVVVGSASSVQGCERYIEICVPVAKEQHRRPAGTDYKKGDPVISAGETIEPRHVMAFASLGYTSVDVLPQLSSTRVPTGYPQPAERSLSPKIGILSTGSELVDARTSRSPDAQRKSIGDTHLYDSNGPYLVHALRARHKADVHYLGTVEDRIELVRQRIADAIEQFGIEILIMTGGVSKGRFDLTHQIIEECFDGEVVFHGVKMRPGAPVLFATIERHIGHPKSRPQRVAVFGLPGNPVAAAAGLQFFVRPYLDMLERASAGKLGISVQNCYSRSGLSDITAARTVLASRKEKTKPVAVTAFWLAWRYTVREACGREVLVAEVFDDQASYKVSVFARSNCWVIVPAGLKVVADGSFLGTVPL